MNVFCRLYGSDIFCMAYHEATSSQLLKLSIVVSMVITLITADLGDLHDLSSVADATVRDNRDSY